MGNCSLKPKVLSEAGAPAPEELKISLLEEQKIDAAKSLSNLFLQDKAEKKTKDEEKTTLEKIPVIEDLKTALAEAKSPTKETKSPATVTQSPVREANAPADGQKVRNEETVREDKVIDDATVEETETKVKPETVRDEKVIDDATVKETETEVKPEEVRREAAAAVKEA